MNLAASIQAVIDGFVDTLMTTIRSASLDELIGIEGGGAATRTVRTAAAARGSTPSKKAPKAPKSGRLQRRTVEQIQGTVLAVVGLVKHHEDGLRSEQIRAELGLDVRELPRVLQQGISDKVLAILGGEKRATRYGVGSGGKPKAAPKTKVQAASKPKAKKAKTASKAKTKPKGAPKKNAPAKSAAAA